MFLAFRVLKKIIYITILVVTLASCEDVIEVKTPSEEPRLIIDALIRVDTSTLLQTIRVKVGLTSPFFGDVVVSGLKEIVIVNYGEKNSYTNPGIKHLSELEPGVYGAEVSYHFLTKGDLTLELQHEDQRYFARANFAPGVPIDTLIQGDAALNKDKSEIITTFTDFPNREDFYLIDFDFANFFTTKDSFYKGEQFQFSYLYNKNLEPGQEVDVSILGVDRAFFNYMNLLIEQSENEYNTFSAPVATVRGNIFNFTKINNIDFFDNVNQTNNFPLGYFAVVQSYTKTIVIE